MADDDPWATLAYSMFAMHQDLPVDQMQPMTDKPELVAPRHQSPEWFAAASSPDASLLDVAPELLAMPPTAAGTESAGGVRPDSDIIGIYAPETTGEYRRPVLPIAPAPAPAAASDDDDEASPRTSVQIGLLRELAELDP